jgi:hypothetical protein
LQVPIRIGLLHGEHGGLLEEYEANRELIERLIAQGGALAGVSGYDDLVAKLKSLQYIDDYYPELLEWFDDLQTEIETRPDYAEVTRPSIEAVEREIEHAGAWVEPNRRFIEAD